MEMTNSKKRDATIDIMRGIGIISVVLGHLWQSGCPQKGYQLAVNFVYSYHLMIFVFCSGYVFKNRPFKEFIFKKIKSLYVPTVVFGVISLSLYPIWRYCGIIEEMNIGMIGKKLVSILTFSNSGFLVGQLWFLPYLFIMVLLFYCINRISILINKKYVLALESIVLSIVGFLGLLVINNIDSSNIFVTLAKRYYIFQAMLSIPVMTVGYYFKKHSLIEKIPRFIWIICFGSMILLDIYTYINIDLIIGNVGGAYFYLATVLGLVFAISVSRTILLSKPLTKIISMIGESSLFILALHIIVFRIIDYIIAIFNHNNHVKKLEGLVDYPNLWFVYALLSIVIIIAFREICIKISNQWRKKWAN